MVDGQELVVWVEIESPHGMVDDCSSHHFAPH